MGNRQGVYLSLAQSGHLFGRRGVEACHLRANFDGLRLLFDLQLNGQVQNLAGRKFQTGPGGIIESVLGSRQAVRSHRDKIKGKPSARAEVAVRATPRPTSSRLRVAPGIAAPDASVTVRSRSRL